MGMQMLIMTVFGIIETLLNITILDKGSLIAVLYVCWGIGSFFEGGKKRNYPKAFLTYMLGLMAFIIATMIIGSLVDLVIR